MRIVLVVIPFLLAAIAAGQPPRLTCLTDVGVFVKNGPTLVKFIPKSTAITKVTKVQVWENYGNTSATVTITPAISRRTATFVFREQARKTRGPSTTAGTAAKSSDQPHSWLLKVPAHAAGNVLLVTMQQAANSRPFGTIQLAQLDIGNDNTLEVDQDLTKGSVAKTFQLGTGAVDIRIVTRSKLSNNYVTTYDFEVGLTLNPDAPIKISSYGPMCGMKLSMSGVVNGSGHTMSGKIEGGFAARGAMLLIGVQPAGIPFPGTPCTILVNPLTVLTFPDFNGVSIFDLNTPDRIDGLIYVQAVSAHSAFGYTSFRMSNGIKIDGG